MGSEFDRSLVVMTPEDASSKIWSDLARRHKRSQFLWNRLTCLRLHDVGESPKSKTRTNDDPRLQLLLMRRDDILKLEKMLDGLEEKVEVIKADACTGDPEGSLRAMDDLRVILHAILNTRAQVQKHQEQMQKQLDAYQDDISKESKLIGGLLTAATELVAKQKMHREKLDQAKDLHQLPTEELQRILGEMDSKIESVSEKVAGAEMLVLEDIDGPQADS